MTPSPRSSGSGPVAPHKPTFLQRSAGRLIHFAIRSNAFTQRFRLHDPHGTLELARARPSIYAIWHNRLAFSLVIHGRYVRPWSNHRRLSALVSASRDGALLTAVLQAFDVEPVRGSSSRRGPQALLELKSWAERGLDLAITPDGPRGPRYRVQPGIIALGRVTGYPIIPVSYHLPWKIQIRSWDRFQIPIPFGRCLIRLGVPLVVSGDSPEVLEDARAELERRLMELTED